MRTSAIVDWIMIILSSRNFNTPFDKGAAQREIVEEREDVYLASRPLYFKK
ncbi:MAG: hypothetical protein QME57_00960 [Patescibacteria group bacterium]|nr:hypothetical protein [Patescibacteria group bacterium]